MWNGDNQKRKADGGGRRTKTPARSSLLAARSSRRGVLLLVVLSMLVLFMLIGTAFLMTSSQSNVSAKASAKKDRLGNLATRLLDRAALQVIRDTENPHSAIRYHSLLRDLYGADGFQGSTYSPQDDDFDPDFLTPISQTSRFAGASNTNGPLGQTQGQFVDIYLGQLSFTAGDALDLRHVLKLDRNVLNQPQIHALPLTKGYYNGCLLTITGGAAAGQSTRVLDYEFIGEFPTPQPVRTMRIFRFRVMGFPRSDGLPLQISADLNRQPEIGDLAGATFIVNGRPFNGTGVGYNPLAATGAPRLNALQRMTDGTNVVGAEVALTPNSAYLDFAAIVMRNADPFIPGPANFLWLNNPDLTVVPLAQRPLLWKYQSFAGPGDADESYDAADFQNMFLALLTVTPRSQGRVVHSDDPIPLDVSDPRVLSDAAEFLRLDLDDLPWPSFHRPDLVNFWYHRLLMLISDGMPEDEHVRAIFQPYQANGSPTPPLTAEQAALITAVKRKIMLRPIREDHPNFNGGNPQSEPPDLSGVDDLVVGNNISIPYWEAVGPWDVDNDNDGINDSIWVDIGDPIIEAEDGTRYKALYSYLIIDLDSRLNVNAHGLADHINPPDLAYVQDPTAGIMPGFNLAGQFTSNILAKGLGYGPAEISLRPVFPLPWADINGTADFNANRLEDTNRDGDQDLPPNDLPIDSYATLMVGRNKLDATGISGKYGYQPPAIIPPLVGVTPGQNYMFQAAPPGTSPTGEMAVPDLHALLKFFYYPWSVLHPTAFGTWPDLKGRYALGIDYTGQPVYEVKYDVNPSDPTLPHNLLANSPYELDLSSSQRRDTLSGIQAQFTTSSAKFFGAMDSNDDAAFATTDLERILRANDADTGMLPSRLWNVVDVFDPIKLMEFDPYRVTAIANAAFGSSNEPERLAAAQQIAAINRHLVTTDGYDLPVPNTSMPAYLYTAPAQIVDPVIRQRYEEAVRRKPANSMTAILELRIRREFGWPPTPFDDYEPNGDHDLDLELNAVDPEYTAANEATARRVRAERISAMVNGGTWRDENDDLHVESGILAPDLIAGKRMDLNRPFGDGRDSPHPFTGLTDGIVDDPLEAGEPFLDRFNANGDPIPNGKWDAGDPYIDLDGDSRYTPPSDQLWADLTVAGVLAEPIAFDYTNGHGEPIHREVMDDLGIDPDDPAVVKPKVRNLDSQGRQLYARHLYCLMLLLVDQDYLAPIDELDPQIANYLDTTIPKSYAAQVLAAFGGNAGQANAFLRRKLTCRMIAQWAVNCVDMRDADAIMTPFEYDENPWDGWGCMERKGNLIPLDGDPATNENGDIVNNTTDIIDWTAIPASGGPKVFTQVEAPNSVIEQTRGVIWGAERPELLITETLAFHDRRAEDMQSIDSNGHDDFQSTRNNNAPTPGGRYPDYDLDQSLRPWGRLFVELYNPWSEDGQRPLDLYSKIDSAKVASDPLRLLPSQGVELGRVSNFGVDNNGQLTEAASSATVKRSPVWRMIVVEEWPDGRNVDPADNLPLDSQGRNILSIRSDKRLAPNFKEPKAYVDMAARVKVWKPTPQTPIPPFYAANPDFDEVFNAGFLVTQRATASVNEFNVMYPYVEREFYFTTDNSTTRQVSDATFKLRIPDRSIKPDPRPPGFVGRYQTQKFIAANPPANPGDVPIAPILPGRYGIVGSAGTKYTDMALGVPVPGSIKDSFTTAIGRYMPASTSASTTRSNTQDDDQIRRLTQMRRIELRPDTNPDPTITESVPNVNQLLVTGNGGFDPSNDPGLPPPTDPDYNTKIRTAVRAKNAFEIGRSNELIDENGTARNINDRLDDQPGVPPDPDGKPDSEYYKPCVAIPVEGMSISEPAWGWAPREREAQQEEEARRPSGTTPPFEFDTKLAYGEGRYKSGSTKNVAYDVQFDLHKPELMRTGTTANYRTIHLQRLANPLLPWNPPPGQIKVKDAAGNDKDLHLPNLPINPYRTVDSSSVDLTAFNGASDEGNYPEPAAPAAPFNFQQKFGQFRPWLRDERGGTGATTMTMTYYDLMTRPTRATPTYPVQYPIQAWHFRSAERGQWAQFNLVGAAVPEPLRTLWAQEPAHVDLRTLDPGNKPRRILDGRDLTTMRVAKLNPSGPERDLNLVPDPIKMGQNIQSNRVDMVMEHSLGFGNESFGRLYSQRPGTPGTDLAPTTAAVGAPRNYPYTFFDPTPPPGKTVPYNATSTYPWLASNNRPLVSADELLQLPAASSAQMLRLYSTIDPSDPPPAAGQPSNNPYANDGYDGVAVASNATTGILDTIIANYRASYPFGHLLNVFATAAQRPDVNDLDDDGDTTEPAPAVAPHFYRILEYVQVPSRYVGTETRLNAETFNDVPAYLATPEPVGTDITGQNDPRYNFQPPYNQVSRERDPGRVNLNTVTGRRIIDSNGIPRSWSEVYDGIMHRSQILDPNPTPHFIAGDGNLVDSSGNLLQLGHSGPAWRDVALSRRGYVQIDAAGGSVDKPVNPGPPDAFQFGLNNNFPTVFANPFRSPDAGLLVPLFQMQQYGVDAALLRGHPRTRGEVIDASGNPIPDPKWGDATAPLFGDARDAGFGNDEISYRNNDNAIPSDDFKTLGKRDTLPLFSEVRSDAFSDTDRNPYMMYQPMTRLGNLVTNRSNVFAVWITVGYFEVEKAPAWSDSGVPERFGGDGNANSPATQAALALYNRVYPDGYMLGREVGSDTGDVKRARGFYILDRTEEVGFKPGDDLNVERMIRLRRRIE